MEGLWVLSVMGGKVRVRQQESLPHDHWARLTHRQRCHTDWRSLICRGGQVYQTASQVRLPREVIQVQRVPLHPT